MTSDERSKPDPATLSPQGSGARIISSAELLGDETEIGIDHDGTLYRLRVTRQGKLILYK